MQILFSYFLRGWDGNFLASFESSIGKLVKTVSTCSWKHFEVDEHFLEKKVFLHHSLILSKQSLLAFWQYVFGKVVKTTFHLLRGGILGKSNLRNVYNFLIIFGQWTKRFRFFSDFLLTMLAELHLIHSKHLLEENIFFFQNKNIFFPIAEMKKNFDCWSTKLQRKGQNFINVTQRTFWGRCCLCILHVL